MAPTNRLIEARRAELRAEANTQKPPKAAAVKRPPKMPSKAKA